MIVKLLTTRAKRAVQESLVFTLPKVKVKVEQGIVKGVIEKLPNGRNFQRFSGIPFAKPPVNELRFRSPQKLLKFKHDEIDCTRERDASFHRSSIYKKYVGSEDCLNLNIYVPEAESSQQLPVMLFIHGGGFAFDSNSRDFYSPEYLLMEDVIVVTINYRFQALGFLCLPMSGISGNATLKDQQMAIQWVHENISSFGGDPNKICLFGESAGAASVHLHTLNPKSRKMINGAIMQSNCCLADWMLQKNGEDKSKKLAKLLGATGNSDEDLLKALMSASPQQIYESNVKVIDSDELRRNLPFVFKPVVEKESDDAFMTKTPLELLRTEKIDIPVMMGLNDGDGITMGSYYRNKLHLFDQDYVRMLPLSLNIDPDSEEAKNVATKIKQFYIGDRKIDDKTITEFVDFMTDFHFTVPQTMCNELHAKYQPNSVQFVYEFCYSGKLNFFKELLKMSDVARNASHFDEIFYLFDAKILGTQVDQNSSEWKMRQTMCKMWTNFAKNGNPTPDNDKCLDFKWNSVKPAAESDEKVDIDYLLIDEKPKMMTNMYQQRVEFWRNLYEKFNTSFLNPK